MSAYFGTHRLTQDIFDTTMAHLNQFPTI
ncbi:hypothetical protein FAIPA1_150078 [Frankia sp. AiPs1]